MINWIKRHKFWASVIVLLAVGFAIEKLSGAEAVYTAVYTVVGVAIATWILFNAKRLLGRSDKNRAKEA